MKLSYQKGVSLIAAVFLITGLALLGSLANNLLIVSTEETINEWYSAQALFAAESGLDWGAHKIETELHDKNNDGDHADTTLCSGNSTPIHSTINAPITDDTSLPPSWFTVNIYCQNSSNLYLYRIQSQGKAGGTATSARASRTIDAQFIPSAP